MANKKTGFNFGNLTSLLLLGVVIVLIGILFSRIDPSTSSTEPSKNLKLYFLITSRSGTFVEDTEKEGVYKLTLQGTNSTVTYIARNPDNYFGRIKLGGFLNSVWDDASPYKFINDAPNAVLTTYNPNSDQEEIIEIELTDPQTQGATVQFQAVQAQSKPKIKSFFDDNTQDFPVEFTNPSLIIDLSKSDTQSNMLEILNSAENFSSLK